MSTLWTAASVTATNGSNLITVQSGEDIAAIRSNSWIMVGSSHIMEIKRTFVTDSGVKTIELFDDWEFGPASGQRATVAPSLGEFKTLADDVRRLIQIGEQQVNTASVAAEPNSFVKRSSGGTVRTAAPEDDNDAVRLQDFAPVKQKGENNEQAISSNSLAILRQKAMAKLERDAVFLAKFTEDRVVKSVGLSKVATSVADGITYISPDGITGIAADGTIQTAGVNHPPIVYDPETGECLGLQTAPWKTNLVGTSSGFTTATPQWGYFGYGNATAALVSGIKPDGTTGNITEVNKTAADDSRLGVIVGDNNAQAGDIATVSIHAKAGTAKIIRYNWVHFGSGVAKSRVIEFDTVTETFLLNPSDATYDFEKLANGWYRLFITSDIEDATNGSFRIDVSPGINEIGTIFVDFAQIENGYLTPYQPTAGSQVSRGTALWNAGGLSVNTSKFTLFADLNLPETYQDFDFSDLVSIRSADTLTRASISFDGLGKFYPVVIKGGGNSIAQFTPADYLGGRVKLALVINGSSVKGFRNGTLMWESSLSEEFSLNLGYFNTLGRSISTVATGTTREGAVIPYNMTDAEAIALTTLEQ